MARPQVEPTEGELWSRDLLDGLRSGGYTPAAWQWFLRESSRRARVIRARRPELTRQSRRWGAAGLAAALPFGPGPVAWWACWWAMLDWHLGMLETPGGDPQPLRGHDALTLARLWAAPVARRHPEPWLVAAALATDLADGAVARRRGPTRLGRDFDSLADTFFLHQVLRGAVEHRDLNPALLILERARLGMSAGVVFASYFGRSRPTPSMDNREVAAALAAAGVLLAASSRPRAAQRVLGVAIGYRALIRVRAWKAPEEEPAGA